MTCVRPLWQVRCLYKCHDVFNIRVILQNEVELVHPK